MSADGPAGRDPEPVQDSALPLRREVTALPDGRRITFYALDGAGGEGDGTGGEGDGTGGEAGEA